MQRTMTRAILYLLLCVALGGAAQAPCPEPPWNFAAGIQMPPASGPASSKVTLYFKPPAPFRPFCDVTFAVREAAITNVEQGYMTVTGKPETRIDISCTLERKPK